MKQLEIIQKTMNLMCGSFINHNNELIMIPKFNVYTLLDNVETEMDFKVNLCEYFSRDCSCALRYRQRKRLEEYWQSNTYVFNEICNTNFTVKDMDLIYTHLGNGINHNKSIEFVKSDFNLSVLRSEKDE